MSKQFKQRKTNNSTGWDVYSTHGIRPGQTWEKYLDPSTQIQMKLFNFYEVTYNVKNKTKCVPEFNTKAFCLEKVYLR